MAETAKVAKASNRGSKPGERRGGRKKGTPNSKTAEMQAKVAESGITPLDYMLSVMRDDGNDGAIRLDAAKSAAPYVHAKLSSIDAKLDIDGKLVININKPS